VAAGRTVAGDTEKCCPSWSLSDAVDSQQPAADAVLDGETVCVLFVEGTSRNIFSTHDSGGWQPSTLRVDEILGSWIRGNGYTRPDAMRVYGYIL
jgi:hypothetical protein